MEERHDPGNSIRFVRLVDVGVDDLRALLGDPRISRHLPLAAGFDLGTTADWARAKDRQWAENGIGPWAILVGDRLAGWGGFQREGHDVDYALVLAPEHWGRGAEITRAALRIGFEEHGFRSVTVLLPLSRDAGRVLARWGFRGDGEGDISGIAFRRFRLSRADWRALDGGSPGLAQAPGNGMAIAALVLGICGFVLTPIPLFIGLFLGGIPSILAVVFGILGLVRSKTVQRGFAPALVGLILGGLAFLSIFIGAGTIW